MHTSFREELITPSHWLWLWNASSHFWLPILYLYLCMPSWHFPFYSSMTFSHLFKFSPVFVFQWTHCIFLFFFQLVATFKWKMLSLNFSIHIKIKKAFLSPPLLWDEIIEAPLLSLAAEPFQSFGPRNHRFRAYQVLIFFFFNQVLILQENKLRPRGEKRLSPQKPQLSGRIRELDSTVHLVYLHL